MFWESALFCHWKEGCYHEKEWAPSCDSCIVQGLGGCTVGTSADEEDKARNKNKNKGEPDPPPPGSPLPPSTPENDPDHSVTTTTVRGANDLGRLFWKELVPEESMYSSGQRIKRRSGSICTATALPPHGIGGFYSGPFSEKTERGQPRVRCASRVPHLPRDEERAPKSPSLAPHPATALLATINAWLLCPGIVVLDKPDCRN